MVRIRGGKREKWKLIKRRILIYPEQREKMLPLLNVCVKIPWDWHRSTETSLRAASLVWKTGVPGPRYEGESKLQPLAFHIARFLQPRIHLNLFLWVSLGQPCSHHLADPVASLCNDEPCTLKPLICHSKKSASRQREDVRGRVWLSKGLCRQESGAITAVKEERCIFKPPATAIFLNMEKVSLPLWINSLSHSSLSLPVRE